MKNPLILIRFMQHQSGDSESYICTRCCQLVRM